MRFDHNYISHILGGSASYRAFLQMSENAGDGYNIKLPIMGGEHFWNTEQNQNGYKLQIHKLDKTHARILDSRNRRIAWGTTPVMKDKFKRICSPNFLLPGDIVGVSRRKACRVYEHYAVYIGNNEVIHYAPKGNAGDFNGVIHKAPFSEFIQDDNDFFVLNFSSELFEIKLPFIIGPLYWMENRTEKIYSAEETIRRAKSRIGENEYNIVMNNCEHFAIWCKTGIKESHQVKKFLNIFSPFAIPVRISYQKVKKKL